MRETDFIQFKETDSRQNAVVRFINALCQGHFNASLLILNLHTDYPPYIANYSHNNKMVRGMMHTRGLIFRSSSLQLKLMAIAGTQVHTRIGHYTIFPGCLSHCQMSPRSQHRLSCCWIDFLPVTTQTLSLCLLIAPNPGNGNASCFQARKRPTFGGMYTTQLLKHNYTSG